MRFRLAIRRHLVIAGVLIVTIGLVASSDTLHQLSDDVLAWAESVISQSPILGMFVFVLLAMLSSMLAFFSSAFLAPIAVYAWGGAVCLALLWVGWVLGGVASFSIGRYFGRSVASAFIGEETIAQWEKKLSDHAKFVHILTFQAFVPSEVPGYVLGALRYRFTFYLLAVALTELPYAAATVWLGESFLDGDGGAFVLIGVAALTLALILWGWARLRPASEPILDLIESESE